MISRASPAAASGHAVSLVTLTTLTAGCGYQRPMSHVRSSSLGPALPSWIGGVVCDDTPLPRSVPTRGTSLSFGVPSSAPGAPAASAGETCQPAGLVNRTLYVPVGRP